MQGVWNKWVDFFFRDHIATFGDLFEPFFSSVSVSPCVPFIINQTPAAGGDHCHGPQRTAHSGGYVGNPFDRAWPPGPTTSGYLQPIFSCVDSRGTHPLCVYVREYGTHTHVC